MKDKLRELAERWKAEASQWMIRGEDVPETLSHCAAELLAILDAEGDGGAVTDAELMAEWFKAAGSVHGPNVETVTMPQAKYLAFRRSITHPHSPDAADSGRVVDVENVLTALGHVRVPNMRCLARIAETPPQLRPPGPQNPPMWCYLQAGHDGKHRHNGGGMYPSIPFRDTDEIVMGDPLRDYCEKCHRIWPCDDAVTVTAALAAQGQGEYSALSGACKIVGPKEDVLHILKIIGEPDAHSARPRAVPDGWKLAMWVLQSDTYRKLPEEERAVCDALIAENPYAADPSPGESA